MKKKKDFKNGIDEILGITEQKNSYVSVEKKVHEECRTTIVTKSEQMNKLKSIAFWDRKTLKEVIEEAFDSYIINYENKNGEIKKIK